MLFMYTLKFIKPYQEFSGIRIHLVNEIIKIPVSVVQSVMLYGDHSLERTLALFQKSVKVLYRV